MTNTNAELMPATSDRWIILVGKQTYEASQEMIDIIKQADQAGRRGMIHFKNFSISLPHIQSMHKVKTSPRKWNEVDPKMLEMPELTKEEKENQRTKIAEFRSKLLKLVDKRQ